MTKNQDPLFEQTSPSFTLNGNNSFLFLLLFFVSFQIYLVSGLWTSLPCYKYVSWLFCGYLMLVPWKRCRKKATWTPENPILPTPKKPMDCSSGMHKHRQHNGLFFLGQMMSWGTFQGRWWAGGAYPLLSPRRGDMIVYVMVNWNSMICASFGAYKIPHIPQRSAAYTYSWISKSNKWNPVITPILPTWMAKDLEISVARVGRIATNKEWKMWCPKGKPANDRPLFAKLAKNTATSDWQPGSIWWHERHVLCVLPSHNLYHTNGCKIWGKASRFPNCPMIELSHKAMFEIVMSYTTIHRSSTTLLHYFRCRV